MSFLTSKQRIDIKNSLLTIKSDIDSLLNETMATDYQLMFFYQELKSKADFANDFIKCANMLDDMKKGNTSFSNENN